jgi:hypothetical protein
MRAGFSSLFPVLNTARHFLHDARNHRRFEVRSCDALRLWRCLACFAA